MTEMSSANIDAANRTLLESGIMTSLSAKLLENGVHDSVITAVTAAYESDKVPSAEKLFTTIKQVVHSSGEETSE